MKVLVLGGRDARGPVLDGNSVELRLHVADETVRYEYSVDGGATFRPLGTPAKLRFSWWKGARPALFSFNTGDGGGQADFDWLRVEPQP